MKKNDASLLNLVVNDYFKILNSTPSRNDALKYIADRAREDLGDYITSGSLNINDEILINLVELLDQTIYEFIENNEIHENNHHIRDYIIDDLYSKLSLTFEALTNTEKYISNIQNRLLLLDDLLIIKNKNLIELVPFLVSESEGITNLQKEIVKTLIYFQEKSLSEFFYNTFRNTSSGFIKSASLLGLKYNNEKKLNWEGIKEIDKEHLGFIQFAEKFDIHKIYKNSSPSSKEELTFSILHVGKNIENINDTDSIGWIISMLIHIPSFNFENSWLHEIHSSVCSILLNIDLSLLKNFLKNESIFIKTIELIDKLPATIFNRLTGLFDSLGIEFLFDLNTTLEEKKLNITNSNSNILNYVYWNSSEII
jgi:hypothetical protein